MTLDVDRKQRVQNLFSQFKQLRSYNYSSYSTYAPKLIGGFRSYTGGALWSTMKFLSYPSISKVIESWELARQKYGSEEEVGTQILLNLFRAEPAAKTVFGFKPNQDVENHPLLRMGVLVHGARIVEMLDGVLMLLGPDTELLEDMLGQLGQLQQIHRVKKEYFCLLGNAVRATLSAIMEDSYTDDIDAAWEDVVGALAAEIIVRRLDEQSRQ